MDYIPNFLLSLAFDWYAEQLFLSNKHWYSVLIDNHVYLRGLYFIGIEQIWLGVQLWQQPLEENRPFHLCTQSGDKREELE